MRDRNSIMRVGVIGINHKLANLELRELLAKACQRQFVIGGSKDENHTFVLLSTCNRTEVYFSSEDLAHTHIHLLNLLRQEVENDFDQKVYSYFGEDCFLHLARVTAGLDSAIVAETEIQGQVKAAYESAASHINLPGELHYLFQKALSIGKKVRSTFPMSRGIPDLEHAVLNLGHQTFKSLNNIQVLFVGASEINKKVLQFLKCKPGLNITLCNRSYDRASVIAEDYGVSILEWSRLNEWPRYQWIIFGTKSPGYLITTTDLPSEKYQDKKLVMDLCVPRNVDPSIAQDPRITLLNIDQINRILKVRQQQMSDILSQAEILIASATRRQVSLFKEKEIQRLQLSVLG